MLKIAICEDNSIHAQTITELTSMMLKIPYETDLFPSGEAFLSSLPPDSCPYNLVLMDIELGPNSPSGISLAQKINSRNSNTQIIFISQYLQYASDVYETKHIYFVNKSKLREYLPKALEAAMIKLKEMQNQFLYFQHNQRPFQIPQNEIIYMERILRTTEIHTEKEVYQTAEKLTSLISQLSTSFCFCHRSYIVNLKAIKTFTRFEILFYDGKSIPIGRSYYNDFKSTFAQMIINK